MSDIGQIALEMEAAGLVVTSLATGKGLVSSTERSVAANAVTAGVNAITSIFPKGVDADIDMHIASKGRGNVIIGGENVEDLANNNFFPSAKGIGNVIIKQSDGIAPGSGVNGDYNIIIGSLGGANGAGSQNIVIGAGDTDGRTQAYNIGVTNQRSINDGDIKFSTTYFADLFVSASAGLTILQGVTNPGADQVLLTCNINGDPSNLVVQNKTTMPNVTTGNFYAFTGIIYAESQTNPTLNAMWKVEGAMSAGPVTKLIFANVTQLTNSLAATAPTIGTKVDPLDGAFIDLVVTAKGKAAHTVNYLGRLDYVTLG